MAVSIFDNTPDNIQKASRILHQGGLVAFPTETVYGLGADASNPSALSRLYQVKGRPSNHPVIVHLADIEQLDAWTPKITSEMRVLAQAFWPGPLTMIVPKSPTVLDEVTGGQSSVGIRIPNHSVALALLQAFQGGIAAPSANRFGQLSPTTSAHVLDGLGNDIDMILEGGSCQVGVESTIIDLSQDQPRILRPGMISQAQIEAVLDYDLCMPVSSHSTTRASGTLPSHYAPKKPLYLLDSKDRYNQIETFRRKGQRIGLLSQVPADVDFWLEAPESPEGYAHALYGLLHEMDHAHVDVILVEQVPHEGLWQAIHDRLSRASIRLAVVQGGTDEG